MTQPTDVPLPALSGWALILGASSGFGAAAALALARAGVDIVGVHLDRRATMPNVERIISDIQKFGREAWFYNVNAADPEKRAEVLEDVLRRFDEGSCFTRWRSAPCVRSCRSSPAKKSPRSRWT
jgi:enoyl-[acyl-carrier protein] reductase III